MKKEMDTIQSELNKLDLGDFFLLFLNVMEKVSIQNPETIQRWHDIVAKTPAPRHAREAVRFVEPCILEFLKKLAEKKRLMH